MSKQRFIVAVDFDNTIVDSKYPIILGLKKNVAMVLNKWAKAGFFIQIHSCRNGEAEWEMQTFLFDNNVPYHAINDHAPWIKQKFFNPHHPISRKLFHHVLIDDTSLHYMDGSVMDWLEIDSMVQNIYESNKWKK
jgi:hypothetical protein